MEPASTRTFDGAPPHAGVPVPARVDRYEVLATLGAGAMGTVYLAYDPQLDRRVALKLSRALGATHLDEGRALARFAHANVVAVHDVGIDGEHGFLVMELVEGVTLGQWLASAQPSWRDIVARLVDAGRGLAAAHAAGIVHRDFKPSNVLIGAMGVRVADFGLATSVPETLAGTPAYLAPELYAGAPASPASDQYAFAVTLFEALARAPAFAGDEDAQRHAKSIAAPSARALPGPRALHRAIERALAPAPEDRWPDLAALLDAIALAIRRRRAIVLALAAAALIGAVALAAWPSHDGADVAAQVERARITATRPDAIAALARARAHGDATLIASAAANLARVLLLEHGPLAAPAPVGEALSAASRAHRPRADAEAALAATAYAMARGEAAEAHRHLARLRAAIPSLDASVRARMASEARHFDAQLLERGGDLEAAGVAYTAIVAAGGDAPQLVEGLFDLARLELRRDRRDEARTSASRALAIAEARFGPDSEQTAMALGLVGASYLHESTARDAAELFRRQLAIEERTHGANHMHVALAVASLAFAAQILGEHAEAITLHERALAIRLGWLGPDHPQVADASLVLAQLHARVGNFDRARELAARAEAIHATTLPETDVRRVANLQALAGIEVRSGHLPEARTTYERALALARRNHHVAETAQILGNRAVVLAQLGRPAAELEPDLREAIALFTQTVGAEHRRLLVPLVQLAAIERQRAQLAAADATLVHAERIVAAKRVDLEKAAAVRLERIQLALAQRRDRRAAIAASERLRDELRAAHLATTDVDRLLATLTAR